MILLDIAVSNNAFKYSKCRGKKKVNTIFLNILLNAFHALP